MAGDWMKVELELPDKPEVHYMAGVLNLDPASVVGHLIKVWAWFNKHTEDGNAYGVTRLLCDRITGVTNFGEAMVLAGWLEEHDKTLHMPKFDRHTSESAKKRALSAARQSKFRNAEVTQQALLREEKRREEVTTKDKGARAPAFTPPTLAEVAAYCSERGGSVDPLAWINYYTANGWRVGKNPMRDWRAAVRTWETNRASSPQRPAKFNPAAASRELAARATEEGDGQVIPAVAGFLRA